MILAVLLVAVFSLAGLALRYRGQRDNLAAAWIDAHPEDFSDLSDE